MSGIDEKPQPQLTFDMVWPLMEEDLKGERKRRNWFDVEYIYYKMVAKHELNVILRGDPVVSDVVEESRWQRFEGWIRNVWYR